MSQIPQKTREQWMAVCECVHCLFNKNLRCRLQRPVVGVTGKCELCLLVKLDPYVLAQAKSWHLKALKSLPNHDLSNEIRGDTQINMNNERTIGSLLKRIAVERKLSFRALSSVLGISERYLDHLLNFEAGGSKKRVNPEINRLLNMADALEIPRTEFLRLCGYLD